MVKSEIKSSLNFGDDQHPQFLTNKNLEIIKNDDNRREKMVVVKPESFGVDNNNNDSSVSNERVCKLCGN